MAKRKKKASWADSFPIAHELEGKQHQATPNATSEKPRADI